VLLVREAEKYFDALYTTGYTQSAPALRFCNWNDELQMTRWVYNCKKDQGNNFSDDPRVATIERFSGQWDIHWKALSHDYHVTINRTSSYLNWRFVQNPKIKYRIFGLNKNGVVVGYIILRVESGGRIYGLSYSGSCRW